MSSKTALIIASQNLDTETIFPVNIGEEASDFFAILYLSFCAFNRKVFLIILATGIS